MERGEGAEGSQGVKVVELEGEPLMAMAARVSNPPNQEAKKDDYARLMRYCIRKRHWSVFEQADMTLEINTSLAIAMQILRHRSFCFQQFSQRYSDASEYMTILPINLRRQDTKNRQNSIDDLDSGMVAAFQKRIEELNRQTMQLYTDMLTSGVAKECARFILPQACATRLYMKGNVRSWIHYIELRTENGTQLEHKSVAEECKVAFIKKFPTVAAALGWELS